MFLDRILPLGVDHFNQNGNLKNITHIDADIETETKDTLQSTQKLSTNNSNEVAIVQVSSKPDNYELDITPAKKNAKDDKDNVAQFEKNPEENDEEVEKYSLWRYPKNISCWKQMMWIIIWPIHLLFVLTIPNCELKRYKNLFPLTFCMCIIWIGSLSYLVAWMITIVGKKE